MFFPERIANIKKKDRVLEIGPGSSPYPRSDVLLERRFKSAGEEAAQRGHTPPLMTRKEIVYYEGNEFPFPDNEFDYVICSHVLEHIVDVDDFVSEITRVGRRGYVEFPTVYFDYLYNFSVHTTLLFEKNKIIYWMLKEESGLNHFRDISSFFLKTLGKGYNELVDQFKVYLFQGFEWEDTIDTKRTNDLKLLTYDIAEVNIRVKSSFKQEILKKLLTIKEGLRRKVEKKGEIG